MISQAVAPAKVKDRRFDSPFRLDPIHGCIFAPWGMFGTLYAVETEAEYEHLDKKFPHTYWFNHFGTFNITFTVPSLCGRALHWNVFERCIASAAILVCLYLPYVSKIRREARCLSIVQPRLPFLLALRHYAFERDRVTLWFLSLLFSFCSWLLWTLSCGVQGDRRLVLCLLMTVSISFALWHSLLLFVRECSTGRRGVGD